MSNPNNPLSTPTDYTTYLANSDDKQAFLAGCRAMIDIYSTSSPDDLAFFPYDKSNERLISLLLNQQHHNHKLQRRDANNIIQSGKPNRAALRAMVFGFYLNDAGYAIDEFGGVIEDGGFQLIPTEMYHPWPHTLARNKQTGAEISRKEYDALPPEQQENYDILRYLDIQNDGILLKRITEDDEIYMAELIAYDLINRDPIAYRYLSECGAGHGTLPRGRFYNYRKTIAGVAQSLGIINEMMAEQIAAGYVNSLGQFYLAWLQSLKVTLTPNTLCDMKDYQLATLKLLLTADQDDLVYSATDEDIMYYRDVNGEGMKGAIPPDVSDPHFMDGWINIPASNERCDLYAQINYICGVLIPTVGEMIIQVFARVSDNLTANMNGMAINELIALVEVIDPDYFEDEDPDAECIGCGGCDGCDGNPNALKEAEGISAVKPGSDGEQPNPDGEQPNPDGEQPAADEGDEPPAEQQ